MPHRIHGGKMRTTSGKGSKSKRTVSNKKHSKHVKKAKKTGLKKPSSNYVAFTKKGKNKAAEKKPTKVVISPGFRQKVVKALEPGLIHGDETLIYAQGFVQLYAYNVANKQWTWAGTNQNVDGQGYYFTPDKFLKAASVLFNGCINTQTAANLQPGGLALFDARSTKFTVKNSYVTYELHNASARQLKIKCWEFAPKRQAAYDPTQNANVRWECSTAGVWAFATTDDAYRRPDFMWNQLAVDDFNTGAVFSTAAGSAAAVDSGTLGFDPWTSPSLRSVFKVGLLKEIILQPGQTAEIMMQGPSDLVFDGSKYFENLVWMNIQKFSRAVVFTAVAQLITGINASVAVAGGHLPSHNTKDALLIESREHYKLSMPEQTAVATGSTRIGRRMSRVIDIIQPTVTQTAVNDYAINNPQTDLSATL